MQNFLSRDSVELNRHEIKHQLDDLPLASLSKAIAGLLQLIRRFENVAVAPNLHAEILVQIEPKVRVLMEILERRLINASFPLERYIDEDVVQMMELLQVLISSGQKLYHLLGRRKFRALADDIALNFSRLYGLAFKTYKVVPSAFWSAFYHFIESSLNAKLLAFEPRYSQKQSNVTLTIKKIILKHLAAPHRLQHHELAMLENLVEEFGAELILSLDKMSQEDPAGLFFIQRNRNQPPRHVAYLDNMDDGMILINTCQVLWDIEAIASKLTNLQKNKLAGLDLVELRNLTRRWWRVSKRTTVRRKSNRDIKIILGLPAVIQKANMDQLRDSKPGDALGIEVIDTDSLHNPLIQPSWAGAHHNQAKSGNTTSTLEWDAQLVDRSATGYCVRWPKYKVGCLPVGSLVAIVDGANTDLGIVRWVLTASKEELSFGVEVFASNFKVQSAYSKYKGMRDSIVLVPPVMGCNRPAIFVSSANTFVLGDEVTIIENNQQERTLKLKRLFERGKGYNIFAFEEALAEPDRYEAEMLW